MRILILVLSYEDGGIYSGLKQSQQETWDSINVTGVDTAYYYGGWEGETAFDMKGPQNKEWCIPVSDEYYMMHWKFRQALLIAKLLSNWSMCGLRPDLIFRTNSSSYINKKRLLQHAETLPKERCFAGWSLGEKEAVSGAGIWLSPDMVNILREEIPPGENIEEDILIGRILHKKHGIDIIDDRSRFDVTNENLDYADTGRYHYRFRTHDRKDDIRNMYHIHQRIKQLEK